MNQQADSKERLPWWRWVLLGLVVAALVVVAGLVLGHYLAGRELAVEVIKAHQRGEPVTFDDLKADLVRESRESEAAFCYSEALAAIQPEALEHLERVNTFYRENLLSLPPNQFPRDLRERNAQDLEHLQPVLEKLDKAAELPIGDFDIGIEQGREVCVARLRRLQKAAFLVSLRTLDLAIRGEDDAAANSVITLLKMTRVFDPYLVLLSHGAKTVAIRLGCADTVLLLQRGRLSNKSLQQLQEALSETVREDFLVRTFYAERVYQMELARNLLPQRVVKTLLQQEAPVLPERLTLPASRWAQLRLRHYCASYLRDMAWLVSISRQPWPEPLDAAGLQSTGAGREPSKLITGAAAFIRLTAETFALLRCTVLAVAVERYRYAHSEVPAHIDDICPAFIQAVPVDPFTGRKLLYRGSGTEYVIYSAGFNRRDDSGDVTIQADDKKPQDIGLRITRANSG
jgi:hypothetical protein